MSSNGNGGLSVQPLVAAGAFNWTFLVEILVCGILALFFLFYFNRLFATVIAYCIRAWTWHKYRAYIDITSLQISLLGGRLFFKRIHYHAHNVTVLVYEGHVTWRYWLRLVQDAEVFQEVLPQQRDRSSSSGASDQDASREKEKRRSQSVGKEENAGGKPQKDLPCRISVKVAGVEAFVYNRSPVYDAIVEQARKKANGHSRPSTSAQRSDGGNASSSSENEKTDQPGSFGPAIDKIETHESAARASSGQAHTPGGAEAHNLPAFLRMFPVKVECKRAAAALGNESTTSVIVAKLARAIGTIDAGHAGPLDWYKLLFNFDMENINVTMKPNRDFKQLQRETARKVLRDKEIDSAPARTLGSKFIRAALKRWRRMIHAFGSNKSVNGSLRTASVTSKAVDKDKLQIPGQSKWQGLARYLDDGEIGEHDEWQNVEYAKASTIADIESLNFRFYFDMPGLVPQLILDDGSSTYMNDINGSKPPEYGMDFTVRGGTVTYGPWTDRQRIILQQIFVPASYVDASPAQPLKAGETRAWTLFNIFVLVEKDITLRIPSREQSKDDKWQGRAGKFQSDDLYEAGNGKGKHKHGRKHKSNRRRKGGQGTAGVDARPYAWLDVTVKPDSTITYTMDMFSRATGFVNKLACDIKATEITSSVNHGLLWRTGSVSLSADLSQPAEWNALRKWPFDIVIDDMELFILRDHMFLIIDLVNDWSYGPPPDFFTFVPYVYSLHMVFRKFVIYLNVNDANIINDPADLNKNDFLTLEGTLDATLDINMDNFRPVRNMITFDVLATDMGMRMISPARSTFTAFLKDRRVAELPKLTLSGSYSGHLEERPGLTDTLRFDIVGSGLTFKAYGFLVRQLINVKENYFGDYMHFKTLEEFQSADDDLIVANIKTASIPKPKSINELDVMLCIMADNITVLFPTNVYACDEFVRAEVPLMNLDLRIVSYYLDMGLQLSPLTLLSGEALAGDDSSEDSASSTQMFVKHMNLDGHRAFGLPPDEPAYINQWCIDVGAISGELTGSFIHDAAMAGRAFVFGFQDFENALPLPSPVLFTDVTFVQVRTETLELWLHAGKEAFLLSLDPVEVATNDWAGETFSQRITVLVPRLTVACVDAGKATRRPNSQRSGGPRKFTARTYAFFETGITVDVVIRKLHFLEERAKQQKHIRQHDMRTQRAPFLRRSIGEEADLDTGDADCPPPAMPYPPLPLPLGSAGITTDRAPSIRSVGTSKHMRTRSSTSSLAASIRSGSLSLHPPVQEHEHTEKLLTSAAASLGTLSRATSPDSARGSTRQTWAEKTQRSGLPVSVMTFSSSYSEPYFPLLALEPDIAQVPSLNLSVKQVKTTAESETSSISTVVDDPDLDEESAQTSVLISVVPGVRAYFEPRVVASAAKVFRKTLPKHPGEVMDAFQMDVLGAVVAEQARRRAAGSTLEIGVELPEARIRVANPIPEAGNGDVANLGMHKVSTMVRIRTMLRAGVEEALAVHVTVDSVEAELEGRPQLAKTITPVRIAINEVVLWVAGEPSQSINLFVGDATASVVGAEAEYLTDCALRLLPVIEDAKARVLGPSSISRQRLMLLIRTLISYSEDVGEPPFLSRMVYILRAFPDHFRNQDSWRVLVRLRHIFHSLPSAALDDWRRQSKALTPMHTVAAPFKELEEWSSWHNWDVPNIHQTIAFRLLLQSDESAHVDPMTTRAARPLSLAVRADSLRIGIVSGPSSNAIVLEDTTISLHQTPPTAPTGLMLLDENTRTKTELQINTSSVAIMADWSMVPIVERLVPLIQRLDAMTTRSDKQPDSPQLDYGLTRHIFHVIVSTETGSITLQSINLRHISRAEGLKMSIMGTTQADEPYGPCASAIINASVAVTELHGRERCIWQTHLSSPSIYIDHLQPRGDADVAPSATVAISYTELQLSLVEPVPGVLSIVNTVIVDEVAQVLNVVEMFQTKEVQADAKEVVKVVSKTPAKVHFALLAGTLRIQLSLLQALKYQLQGTAASVRIAPSLHADKSWAIDYDVGRQMHCFINSSADERHTQDILDVPPINGRVGLQMEDGVTNLSVATTLDRVEIDATAIQGVVALLARPEVQNVISSIKHGIADIQRHIKEVNPEEQPHSSPTTSESRLAFNVRFALKGIRVAASTPTTQLGSTAEVEFGIGPVYAIASNKASIGSDRSLLPEVRAEIRGIGASLVSVKKGHRQAHGNVKLGVTVHFKSHIDSNSKLARELNVLSRSLEVNAYPETASTAVDVINHLQDSIKDLDLSSEMEYLRRLRDSRRHTVIQKVSGKNVPENEEATFSAADLLSVSTTVELADIRISWLVPSSYASNGQTTVSDLVLTLDRIELTTHGGNEARLAIQDMQIQLAPHGKPLVKRALNSALLSEVSFSVAYWPARKNRSIAFKAAGKPLEIRLESKFVVAVDAVQRSIADAIDKSKLGTATWKSTPTSTGAPRAKLFDTNLLTSLLMEADFAGAIVYIQGSGPQDGSVSLRAGSSQQNSPQHGRYGQFAAEGSQMQTTLRAPGIAIKLEYHAKTEMQAGTINGEVQVEASSNLLLPTVVPLIIEITNGVKEVMQKQDTSASSGAEPTTEAKSSQRFFEDEAIISADPAMFFGKMKVDLGLRIAQQEFAMTCQPIARVDAKAQMKDLYITVNTIDSDDHGRFFAISAVVTKLTTQVKHVYSREPTFSFDMESVNVSVLNSKHLSGSSGISAILKINPTRTSINAKQLQDLLIFREIWLPPEIRATGPSSPRRANQTGSERPEEFFAQKYRSVASAAAFPWNATIAIAELAVDLDLSQSIGKSSFTITDLWASQAKSSDWEQNLCIGMEEMAITSSGRMSGFIKLSKLGVRTSIRWPDDVVQHGRTPLIQASIGFQRLRTKAAFDYQAFAFGDIEGFDFVMYNVHQSQGSGRDRLVAVLDCEKAYVFCTSTSPAQAVGLVQAFERLIQDKQQAYVQSLKDIEKHVRRESTFVPTRFGPRTPDMPSLPQRSSKNSISLHTDVILTIGTISAGVYPSTFFDSQLLKLEANNIQARFAVGLESGRIQSGLGMTLGQLQVALATVKRVTAVPRALDVSVDDVINNAVHAKGGTILRVPKVVASMQTWQHPESNNVDYIFRSLFEGKIDVGWNLSRIDFIKNMWVAHARSLAARLGKALPESAVKITAGPVPEDEAGSTAKAQEKITAEVNLPQSRYEYHALEPAIIETPQLRDMGEATPPLEWIGLQRDRLPNVTHQIIIVSLLEVAKEVEDAYERILGST